MSNRKKPTNKRLIMQQALRGMVAPRGVVQVALPSDEKVIVKEVPAVVDGVRVGIAQIDEDGGVEIILDADAPKDKLAIIKSEAGKVGYELGPMFPMEE